MAEPLFWKLALIAAEPLLFWFGFRWWRRARLIEDTPTSRIRSAAQGYVELSGRAQLPAGSEVLSPLSRRPCVWWQFRIEQKRRSGRNTRWQTINSGISPTPFLLVDETDTCLVNPLGAEVFPADKSTWYGSSPWPNSVEAGFFGRFAADYRYTEHRIYQHERVDAIGEFRSLGGVRATDAEQRSAELLRQWKQDQPGLLQRFDENRDGLLSQKEWETTRRAARRQVDTTAIEAAVPQHHVLGRPAGDQPFLLAACELGQVARRYRWWARGMLAAFVVVAGVLAMLWLG